MFNIILKWLLTPKSNDEGALKSNLALHGDLQMQVIRGNSPTNIKGNNE